MRVVNGTLFAFALGMTLLSGSPADAAYYGDFTDPSGETRFLSVRDENGSFDSATMGLDTLSFKGPTLLARCVDCPGGEIRSDIVTLDIQSSARRGIRSIEIGERLDYMLHSFDTMGSSTISASSTAFVDILEVDGLAINGLNAHARVDLTPSGSASVHGIAVAYGVLSGTASIDLDPYIADAGLSGFATRVRVSVDVTFMAYHDGVGGQAMLRFSDAAPLGIAAVGSSYPVPEPTTATLVLAGLAALSGISSPRRPSSASRSRGAS